MTAESPDTPRSLLEQTRDPQNTTAWDRFCIIYKPLLSNWFRSNGLQSADADDLVQRTFQLLLRKLPQFDHTGRPGAFRTWLRNVALNMLRDFRKGRPHPGASGLDERAAPSEFDRDWDREHDLFVLNGLLEAARSDFSQQVWKAFALTALEGKPAAEAAAALGMTTNAVMLARSRVLARLRRDARGLLD